MSRMAYVTGRISGIPEEHVSGKFNMITEQLAIMGYHVVRPIGVSAPESGEGGVRNDIKKMLECDEVHLLPGWQESKDAQLERDIALRLGMQVVYH